MAHLLIVEDDELLRDALGAQLAQAGHRITTAADGAEALELLALQGFDGVVLDLGLPLVDGLTVLRRLRQRLPALPVLILTARDGVEDRVEGLNAGADDYLTKPFNRDELLARLQALLRRASLPAFGANTAPAPAVPAAGNLRLDPQLPRAWLGNEAIDLTQREWVLLDLLVGIFVGTYSSIYVGSAAVLLLGAEVAWDLDEVLPTLDVCYLLRVQFERAEAMPFPSNREYATLYGMNMARMAKLPSHAIVMHPGPMNRGVEISADVADSSRSVILGQVESGVAVRMAVMYLLLGGADSGAAA